MAVASNDLQEVLKPFYKRASDAEDRLERLEASLASKKDSGNEELLKKVNELQSKLEDAKHEQVLEREKALKEVQQLASENVKLQYRITHLVRALKEADGKLASNQGDLLGRVNQVIESTGNDQKVKDVIKEAEPYADILKNANPASRGKALILKYKTELQGIATSMGFTEDIFSDAGSSGSSGKLV